MSDPGGAAGVYGNGWQSGEVRAEHSLLEAVGISELLLREQ